MQLRSLFCLLLLSVAVIKLEAQSWSVNGNSGTSSSTNFVGTVDNVDLKLRANNSVRLVIGRAGSVSVGTSVSSLAKFTVSGGVGNTTSIFGTGSTGVSLQYSYPGISFNSYYNAGYKALAAGYGGNFTLDPTNGKLHYRAISNGAGTGSAQTFTTPFVITNGGTVGINNTNPDVTADLHIGTSTGAKLRIGDQTELKDAGNMILEVSSTFRPTADNAYRLGGSSWRWIDVWAVDGTINTSDRRDKTNIRDIGYGLNEVMKMHPVVFNWKDAPERGDKLGLIAQELESVIKEAVVSKTFTTDENGNKLSKETEKLGVYYSDLTPVLVKAIQQQQEQLKSQQQQNDELRKELNDLKQMVSKLLSAQGTGTSFSSGILGQNVPNPVQGVTSIQYALPEGSSRGQLLLIDAMGRTIQTIQLNAAGVVKVDASTLSSGVYHYSLLAEGKTLKTKKMRVVR